MRIASYISALLLLCVSTATAQHQRIVERLRVGKDIHVFHAEKIDLHGGVIPIAGPQDSEGHDGDSIARLIVGGDGTQPFLSKRSYGLRNGVAGIGIRDGQRYIIWDPAWGISNFVLAHEIGHHTCKHTIEGHRASPHEKELEADRYAGAAIKQVEEDNGYTGVIDQTIEQMRINLSTEGSRSHPPLAMRIAALTEGYKDGSPCK